MSAKAPQYPPQGAKKSPPPPPPPPKKGSSMFQGSYTPPHNSIPPKPPVDCLHHVEWLLIGTTNAYSDLKKDIAHVCRDVTHAACIDEICINDIIRTFLKHGYVIIKEGI